MDHSLPHLPASQPRAPAPRRIRNALYWVGESPCASISPPRALATARQSAAGPERLSPPGCRTACSARPCPCALGHTRRLVVITMIVNTPVLAIRDRRLHGPGAGRTEPTGAVPIVSGRHSSGLRPDSNRPPGYRRLISAATYPAPNPLSIFTTLTFDAQELIIPKSAASP